PQISITNIAGPGVPSDVVGFRDANNLLFQETQTKLSGRHTFRYGLELLQQLATQSSGAITTGAITYNDSPGYSAFANFLDDFSGQPGRIRRTIGADVFHPDDFRQSYFFQDAWKTTPSLTLTLGLRYENFGQPANSVRYPAFTGFDPDLFFQRNHVSTDNKDFGPAIGLAWSPSAPRAPLLSRLFGDHKTVLRGGYQISIDILSLTPTGVKEKLCLISARPLLDWGICKLIAPDEAEGGSAGTQPRQGIIRRAHRADRAERWNERSAFEKHRTIAPMP